MKSSSHTRVKEHYQTLRKMSPEALWSQEVPAFDAASPAERVQSVSVVRAVGVVFSEAGTPQQCALAREWLRSLLADPEEKVRRYAMVALPKMGSGAEEEKQLLGLLGKTTSSREDQFLAQTLGRIGGSDTLKAGESGLHQALAATQQKVRANIARNQRDGGLDMRATLQKFEGVRIALECRTGLESVVLEELSQTAHLKGVFKVLSSDRGRVVLRPEKPFSPNDLYTLRCFSDLVFLLSEMPPLPRAGAPLDTAALAETIASALTQNLLTNLTKGAVRYRLEFPARKADAPLVEAISKQVFAKRPALLNDSRDALWEIRIGESARSVSVELRPRLRPDPRFEYRQGDVPAASHPPLAAAMARLARVGSIPHERIWDPFCGSGLELAECLLLGGVSEIFGTDLSLSATAMAASNVDAAARGNRARVRKHFETCDFRRTQGIVGLRDLTLIITNPPLGKRVPVGDMRTLVTGLFSEAQRLLRTGGRLVFVNPLDQGPEGNRLRLESSQKVDLGFAHFHLEKYVRT